MPTCRIPPIVLGALKNLAADEGDRLSWGQRQQALPDLLQKAQGEGVHVGILDTGAPEHPDLPDFKADPRVKVSRHFL